MNTGVILASYFQPWEEEAKSPCTSGYDPDHITNILDPVANTAAMEAGSDDTVCIFCIVPCDPDAPQGSCDQELAYAANYSLAEGAGSLTVSLTPAENPPESNQTTAAVTIVELKKLPDAWEDETIYGDHHLLILQVIYSGGEDQTYDVEIQENIPGFKLIFTV